MRFERFAELVNGYDTGYRDVAFRSERHGDVKLVFCAPLRRWCLKYDGMMVCFQSYQLSVHDCIVYLYFDKHTHVGSVDLLDLEEVSE